MICYIKRYGDKRKLHGLKNSFHTRSSTDREERGARLVALEAVRRARCRAARWRARQVEGRRPRARNGQADAAPPPLHRMARRKGGADQGTDARERRQRRDRKSTRLNSSH